MTNDDFLALLRRPDTLKARLAAAEAVCRTAQNERRLLDGLYEAFQDECGDDIKDAISRLDKSLADWEATCKS